MTEHENGQMFGRYRLGRHLGSGGMGVVHAATDPQLGRQIALKIVNTDLADDHDFIARFRREATLLARLDSPHVVTIYDHGMVDGVHYIATQLVPGGDLESLLREKGPLPQSAAVRLAAQLAQALHEAHTAGIVHRDVKPRNVLIRDPNAAELHGYLCDFGIASGQGATRLTRTGTLLGSFSFTAPEVARGEEAGKGADLYALGCVLWSCLTGHPPYQGTEADVLLAHLEAPVPQLPGTDPQSRHLNRVLAAAMAKDPAGRFASAAEMRSALLGTGPISRPQPPARPTESSRGRSGRRSWIAGVAVGGLLVAAAGIALWLARSGGDPAPTDEGGSAGEAARSPHAIAADFDGDRKGDLTAFVARGDDLDVVDWRSTGTAFSNPTRVAWSAGGTGWGDHDGDAILDRTDFTVKRSTSELVATTTLSSDDSVHAVPTGVRLDDGFPQYVETASGDFDGDGHIDLALVSEDSDGLWIHVMLNDGTRLTHPVLWVLPKNAPLDETTVFAGDWDLDGIDDLVLLGPVGRHSGADRRFGLQLLRSTGSGFDGLSARRPLSPGLRHSDLAVGDLSGDGDRQIVAVSGPKRNGTVRVEVLDYDGTLDKAVSARTVRPLGPRTRNVTQALTDVNGDGRADLVLIPLPERRQSVPISVLLAEDDGFADPVSWGVHTTSVSDWTSLAPTNH